MNIEQLFPNVSFKSVTGVVYTDELNPLIDPRKLLTFAGYLHSYSKLPSRLSSDLLEVMFSESIGGFRLPGGGKIDIVDGPGKVAYQLKTMTSLTKSIIWGRIALEDKLAMIPASTISYDICQLVAKSILSKLREDFIEVLDSFESFRYLQLMKDGSDMYLVISEIDLDKLEQFLDTDFMWSWTSKPVNPRKYPSLCGHYKGQKIFSWSGLSGNHFRILDMGVFLSNVSKKIIGVKIPLSGLTYNIKEISKRL